MKFVLGILFFVFLVGGSFFFRTSSFLHSEILVTESDSIDMGTISFDEERRIIFHLKNKRTFPLLIYNINTSCGCTKVRWEKTPIMPQKIGKIIIDFKPNSLGRINKIVEVDCNTSKYFLKIKGKVIE